MNARNNTVQKILEKFAAHCDQYNREIEYDTSDNMDYDEAVAAIEVLIADAELRAEIKLLKKCYIDQDEIWVKFDGGFAEQYERIKQLQAQLQARGEKRK
jgi:hypothetical protein